MIHDVALEKLDANMEEATIGEWLVAEGDRVDQGAPLVGMITDKATFDYESPVAGTVRRIAAAPGSVIPVGYVFCQIGDRDGVPGEIDERNRQLVAEHKRRSEVEVAVSGPRQERPVQRGERVRATPAARRLAKEHGLDLAEVKPAEPGRVVDEADVRRHLSGGA